MNNTLLDWGMNFGDIWPDEYCLRFFVFKFNKELCLSQMCGVWRWTEGMLCVNCDLSLFVTAIVIYIQLDVNALSSDEG